MDKVQLIKIINEVVEYKLKKLVPQVEQRLRESIEKELLSKKMEEVEEPSDFKKLIEAVDAGIDDEGIPVVKLGGSVPEVQRKKKEVHFSKNEILNKVLNETMTSPKRNADSDYERILAEMTGTDDQMQDVEALNFNSMNSIISGLTPIKSPSSAGRPSSDGRALKLQIAAESGNPDLANIIVKDYREVLKKAAEKAKAKRG